MYVSYLPDVLMYIKCVPNEIRPTLKCIILKSVNSGILLFLENDPKLIGECIDDKTREIHLFDK